MPIYNSKGTLQQSQLVVFPVHFSLSLSLSPLYNLQLKLASSENSLIELTTTN